MTGRKTESLALRLGEDASGRFVRWDADLWERLVSGPAQSLVDGLGRSRAPVNVQEQVLRDYLHLACEGIGGGYILPNSTTGAWSFMTLAWMELLPQQLPTLNGRGMATLLALCWNLGENLDRQPAWLRCLFREVCEQEGSGIDVSAAVDRVAVMAMEPAAPGTKEAVWLDFAKRDLWFFPGEIHALAPGVLCVHDREGRGSAQGVCLGSHVQVMGPTGCREEGPFSGLTRLPKPRPAGLRDISIGRVYHCVTQSGWSAMSLRYSQRLLMVKSGPDSG